MRFGKLALAALLVLAASHVQAQTVVTFDDLTGGRIGSGRLRRNHLGRKLELLR